MKVKNGSVYEYYLVREDILPEAIKKTIRVQKNLNLALLSTFHDIL